MGFCHADRVTWAFDGAPSAASNRPELSAGAAIKAAAAKAATVPAVNGARNI